MKSAQSWYLCSEFFLLRVLPRPIPPDPAGPRHILKKYYPAIVHPIIDLRRYQVYEKTNSSTQV